MLLPANNVPAPGRATAQWAKVPVPGSGEGALAAIFTDLQAHRCLKPGIRCRYGLSRLQLRSEEMLGCAGGQEWRELSSFSLVRAAPGAQVLRLMDASLVRLVVSKQLLGV